MKIFSSESVFEHPWSLFTRALWNKYPNPFSPHVLSCDTLDSAIDPETGECNITDSTGILCTTRILVKKGKLPSWGSVFLKNNLAYIIEFSTVDPNSQVMTTITSNISYKKLMLVQETCSITFTKEGTCVKTLAEIVSNTGSSWIRSRIEGFGLSKFKYNFQNSSLGVLHVIECLKSMDAR